MKVVYLPLDERPCNREFAKRIASGSDVNIIAPKEEILGDKKRPADSAEIRSFLLENASAADCFIIAVDMLLYGGIVPSRLHNLSYGELSARLSVLDDITTKTHSFFYAPSERFTIPLGAMIPIETKNLIPACKNIATTHLTNGCYRLHPVEWNVGEVAGLLAAFALERGVTTKEIWESKALFDEFAALIESNGIQRYWKN